MDRQLDGRDKAPEKKQERPEPENQPPGEEEFGGGDFCSPVQEPSTEDDKPLD